MRWLSGTLVFAFLAAARSGIASPACIPGTLASYAGLGSAGCAVGPLTFSNFRVLTGAEPDVVVAPEPSEITVTPAQSPITVQNDRFPLPLLFSGFGFTFSIDRTLGPFADIVVASMFVSIVYEVRSSGPGILGAALAADMTATSAASAIAQKFVLSGGALAGDCPAFAFGDRRGPRPADACFFEPSDSILVDETVDIGVGLPSNQASVGDIENRFGVVPEPGGMAAIGLGILAFVWLVRRSRKL